MGGAKDLRIRGTSSFTLNQRPVVYIDGVRADTRATDWTANLGNQACCNFNGGTGEDRLSDLNPDDIDHIEVLKGAAAATLYGSEASNGVIQIFTKRGQGRKRAAVGIELRHWLRSPTRRTIRRISIRILSGRMGRARST